MTHHDAQHLIPHAPADDGGGGQDAPAPHFCGDCGEPIAHEGAPCLNCAANACTGCGRMLDEFGQCPARCWTARANSER